MVNFGVDVIGTAREDNAVLFIVLTPLYRALALGLDILLRLNELAPARMCRGAGLGRRNVELLLHDFLELRRENLLVRKGHEGAQEADMLGLKLLDIVLDVLGIARDNRAVVVISGAVLLIPLVGNAGVEDGLHAVLDEPGHMTVRNLCRVALRLRGNRLDAELVDFPGRDRREHNTEAELTEENRPERIVFVEVQHAGNADCTARCLALGECLNVKAAVHLVVKEVRDFFLLPVQAETALAAIARDKAAAAAELVHGEHALVVTALTARHGSLIL